MAFVVPSYDLTKIVTPVRKQCSCAYGAGRQHPLGSGRSKAALSSTDELFRVRCSPPDPHRHVKETGDT